MKSKKLRWMLALAFVCGNGASGQVFAVFYSVTLPAGTSPLLPLEAGQSAALQFDVLNQEAVAGIASVAAQITESGVFNSEYTVTAGQPAACATPVPSVTPVGNVLTFPIALTASQLLRCTYRLTRTIGSIDDVRLRLGINASYAAGTLPDLSIAGEIALVPYGAMEAVTRISQRNPSPREVAGQMAETPCITYPAGIPPPVDPFVLEGDFPGACQSLSRSICGIGFLGFTGSKWRFMLGAIPAHGETSCLLRLRFPQPLTSQAALGVVGGQPPVQFTDGGTGYDLWNVNNGSAFGAMPAVQPVPTNGWVGLLGLASTMIVMVMAALRRRRPLQRS